MSKDFLALVYSFIYVVAIVGIAFILYRFTPIKSEGVRKFIHIAVSGWVFILTGCFSSLFWASLGPALFIIINATFVYSGLGKYLGMGDRKRDNGLIYYPFSLLILVIMLYKGYSSEKIVIASVLTMGLGDGAAALIGSSLGRHKYSMLGGKKSIEGTAAMFAVTLAILLSLFPGDPLFAPLIVALAATFLENITPLGFDNITVPIGTALILGAIYGVH